MDKKQIARELELIAGKRPPYSRNADKITEGMRLAKGTFSDMHYVYIIDVAETEKMMKFTAIDEHEEIITFSKKKTSHLNYI